MTVHTLSHLDVPESEATPAPVSEAAAGRAEARG